MRERHTVDAFSSPADLAEKLRRDFQRYFARRVEGTQQQVDEFETTLSVVERFLLMPKSAVGREVRLQVPLIGPAYPASRALCGAFNLDYGSTIGLNIKVMKPGLVVTKFKELYAVGARAEELLALTSEKKLRDLYVRLRFSEQDVHRVYAEFFDETYYAEPETEPDDHYEYQVSAEGKVIMLFSKIAQ